jgi:ABC-type sugar transport system ATPase subunit
MDAGIRVVYQEFNLLSCLSVAENTFFDRKKLYADAAAVLRRAGPDRGDAGNFRRGQKDGGSILLDGREVRISSPRDAVANGICLLAEDRKSQGLILDMPLYANISMAALDKFTRGCPLLLGMSDFARLRLTSREKTSLVSCRVNRC